MEAKKWGAIGLGTLLLVGYNAGQSGIVAMRTTESKYPGTKKAERYGPSLVWVDRLMAGRAGSGKFAKETKLDFNVLSSMMVAGLASGFKSQVANLLWMKSDEYWHKGLLTRQVPLMEAVVTLDPQFIEAWSTAGWHWAYNIYADLPERPDLKKQGKNSAALRREQERTIEVGLDYLTRGANLNPETYRLWFENGWTRYKKAGILDEETVRLLRNARAQKDARELERTVADANAQGKSKTLMVEGDDLVGRNIGHVYEDIPQIDKALDHYIELLVNSGLRKQFSMSMGKEQKESLEKIGANDWDIVQLIDFYKKANEADKATIRAAMPQIDAAIARGKEIAAIRPQLIDAGKYWGLYGKDYSQIAEFYRTSDAINRAQIKKLVPDVERLVEAQKARETAQAFESQATGAFVSIAARYYPAWQQMQAGKLAEATNTLLGVMNADGVHHVQKMPVLAKVFELRGDEAGVIQNSLAQAKQFENDSSQEIGLHFLAVLYEKQMNAETDPAKKKALARKAYETWYRARERNTLDFYARRNSLLLEDTYKFSPPQNIIDEIKKSRNNSKGGVNAAPPPPNVSQYQSAA
ncbi:MAG TPA: hypothetical protein VF681_11685 [Abditibacteriaceae bacterium]|jgi:hypothetical protein